MAQPTIVRVPHSFAVLANEWEVIQLHELSRLKLRSELGPVSGSKHPLNQKKVEWGTHYKRAPLSK